MLNLSIDIVALNTKLCFCFVLLLHIWFENYPIKQQMFPNSCPRTHFTQYVTVSHSVYQKKNSWEMPLWTPLRSRAKKYLPGNVLLEQHFWENYFSSVVKTSRGISNHASYETFCRHFPTKQSFGEKKIQLWKIPKACLSIDVSLETFCKKCFIIIWQTQISLFDISFGDFLVLFGQDYSQWFWIETL